MSDDDHAWPSLILAKHEIAHREHVHQHQHQHHLHHRGQTGDVATATAIAIQSIVTEITATVSVIQQIDVDSNGSTFAIQTILASTPSTSGNDLTTTAASPGTASTPSSAASTTGGSPQISSASLSLNTNTSTSASATLSTSTFSSLIASSNSTTLISSSSNGLSATPNFANSSTSCTSSSSSFTYLTSSSSSEESSSSTSSTSSLYSPSFSPVVTSAGGGIGGGTAPSTSSTSTSTAGAGSGSGSSSNTSTPVVVGGVVGSIAGAAIIIFLLLAFIRWKKRHQSMLSLGSGNEGPATATSRDGPPGDAPSGGMAERRSLAFIPAALTNLTGFNKRTSRQTDRTISSTAGSERGFYRVSGRKLPSVLQTGGDGYGGGIADPNTLSGSSFYRDSQGFYGGPGSPTTVGAAGASTRPESGVPVMRPSPARTPVTQQGPFSAVATAPLTPPRRPDVLGRSHPSQDGSHTSSRFTEDV